MPVKKNKEPPNKWLFHLMTTKSNNPDKSYREVLDIAKKTYVPKRPKPLQKPLRPIPATTRRAVPAVLVENTNTTDDELDDVIEGDGIKRVVKDLQKIPKKLIKRVDIAVSGRKDLPLKSRRVLDKYGDEPIQSMVVVRRPIMPVIEKSFKLFSGDFNKIKKNLGYDALQHLALIVKTKSSNFRLEKLGDDDVKITKVNDIGAGETMSVNMNNRNITMNEMIDKTKNLMGSKFLPYNSENNNCQVFVTALLKSVQLLTPDLSSFINQDIERLYKELKGGSFLKRLVQNITDIGGVAERAITGEGRAYTFKIMR